MTRKVPEAWNDREVRVLVIGAGGNGSEVLDGLISVHLAMRGLRHPGLVVTMVDDDVVSEHNVVRQRFWPHEIGLYKAVALVHRANMALGLHWNAVVGRFAGEGASLLRGVDVIFTCVDTISARKSVYLAGQKDRRKNSVLWVDMGVEGDQGQVIAGWLDSVSLGDDLPNVVAHYPTLLDLPDEHARPSCSAADSLARQGLFVNRAAANAACQLIWDGLRAGQFNCNGALVVGGAGHITPINLPALPSDV